MKRVAIFAVLLGLGLLVAPGLAQNTGLGSSVAEELDPIGSADAHTDIRCFLEPCICYIDQSGYHCHYS